MANKLIQDLGAGAFALTDLLEHQPIAGPPSLKGDINALVTLLNTIYAPITGGAYVLKAGDTMTGKLIITQATANTSILTSTGYSLTGANAQNMLDFAGTWNTSGNPTALRLSITNTASGATSKLLELLAGAAGATSVFMVDTAGTLSLGIANTANIASFDHGGVPGIRIRQGSAAGADGIISGAGFWSVGGVGYQTRNAGATELYIFMAGATQAVASQFALNWANSTTDASSAKDLGIARTSAGILEINNGTPGGIGALRLNTAGALIIASGANQRAGNLTLIGGTLTVANTSVTANSVILLTRQTAGGTIGFAVTYTVIASTSFTVTSDNALDTSTYSYLIIEVP